MAATALASLLIVLGAVLFGAFILAAALRFARGRRAPADRAPVGGGGVPLDPVQPRFHGRFFAVALLFLLLQLESAFLIPWMLSLRAFLAEGAGGHALAALGVFLLFLAVGLIHEWRKGGLD